MARNALIATLERRARRGEGGSFFGQSPKNEPHLLLFASEASKKEVNIFFVMDLKNQGGFMVVIPPSVFFGVGCFAFTFGKTLKVSQT